MTDSKRSSFPPITWHSLQPARVSSNYEKGSPFPPPLVHIMCISIPLMHTQDPDFDPSSRCSYKELHAKDRAQHDGQQVAHIGRDDAGQQQLGFYFSRGWPGKRKRSSISTDRRALQHPAVEHLHGPLQRLHPPRSHRLEALARDCGRLLPQSGTSIQTFRRVEIRTIGFL